MGRLRAWFGRPSPRPAPPAAVSTPLPPGALYVNPGYCPVCCAETRFVAYGEWLRDLYVCELCGSIPRERALITVLEQVVPDWRELRLHESSPGRPECARRIASQCPGYLVTNFHPDAEPGAIVDGFRSENLESLTFDDESFDVVITQDVMEHVLDPARAFREIARTLRPGGHHVFTTPVCMAMTTSQPRARRGSDGEVELLAPPEYHGTPVDPKGALVTMLYGADIASFVEEACGLPTTIHRPGDPHRGIVGEFLEVVVTAKPADADERLGSHR